MAATMPATTGEATLVPDIAWQPVPNEGPSELEANTLQVLAQRDYVRLDPAIAGRQLPGCHASAREGGDFIRVRATAHADHVNLICWVTQRAPLGAVISNGRHLV